MSSQKTSLLLASAILSLALSPVEAAKLFRWVDEEGQVHYTDKIPASAVDKARAELDKSGVALEQVEAAKSREELILEAERKKEIEKLRVEQQRLIEEEKAKDDALLRTFATEDDILMARDNKLAAVDVKNELTRTNITRIKEELADLQRNAADAERQGQKASDHLLKRMDEARERLNNQYGILIGNEKEKEALNAEFQVSLDRFRTLKKLTEPAKPVEQQKVRFSLLEDSLIPCATLEDCVKLWPKAEKFMRANATTRIQILSENVMLTARPAKDDDISITISRIPEKGGSGFYLFMDLQCNEKTPRGLDFCRGPKVQEVRKGFKTQVAGGN